MRLTKSDRGSRRLNVTLGTVVAVVAVTAVTTGPTAATASASVAPQRVEPQLAVAPTCSHPVDAWTTWPSRACSVPLADQKYYWVAADVTNSFYVEGYDAFKAAAGALGVHGYLIGPTTSDVADQVSDIDALIAQKDTAGIIAYPISYPTVDPSLIKAQQAGIPVILGNGDSPDQSVRTAFVGTDNVAFGATAADLAGKLLNGKGTVGIIGLLEMEVHIQRVAGFKAEIKAKFPNIKIVDIANEDGTEASESAAASALLTAHPNVNLIWTSDAGSGVVAAVVKERGLAGKVILVGSDHDPAEISAVCSGEVAATVEQDTFSEENLAMYELYWLYNKVSSVPNTADDKAFVATKATAGCTS